MQVFRDAKGNGLSIRLTIGLVAIVLAKLKIDLRRPDDPESTQANQKPTLVSRLWSDPFLFVELLKELLAKQFAEEEVDLAAWADELDGATIGAARDAFFKEWRDFFHGLGTPHLADQIQAELDLMNMAGKLQVQKIREFDVEAEMRKRMTSISTESPGSGPESSESTPAT
jgi:hypothetical protein